jgi:putative transposase
MLVGEVAEYIKEILKSIAEELGCEIITLEVIPDHIHLFVNCPPRYSPSYLANYFKGKSARLVLKKFPELRKYTNPVRVRLVILCQKGLKVCFISLL